MGHMIQTIKHNINKILLALFLILGLGLAYSSPAASAQDLFQGSKGEACSAVGASSGGECDQKKLDESSNSLTRILNRIIDILSIIVGIISVIMIIVAGFRFITSGGDSGQISSAKNTLIYAIVGLIIVALAQIIVKFVLSKV